MTAGLLGGLPVSSVVIRATVNINAGARTKLSTITHGLLILLSVVFAPGWINKVPMSCLAAILLMAGFKLTSPQIFRDMWSRGWSQFLPFIATVLAIIFSDLLIGVIIGLVVAISFILASNIRHPLRRFIEKQVGSEVLRIELANQVSFLNCAALNRTLGEVPRGGHVLLDARNTDYIDTDVLELIHEFERDVAPARGVKVSFLGFRDKYEFEDLVQYVDFSSRELQESVTPAQVLQILKDGNHRFRTGQRLTRDLGRLVAVTAAAQHPLAVVLGCIDSRTPAELIFDLGVGDIFVVRIAGNVSSPKVLGSIEFACALAGAKLVLVLGHTRCGAVKAAVELAQSGQTAANATGCQHLDDIIEEVRHSFDPVAWTNAATAMAAEREALVDAVACRNVRHVARTLVQESRTLAELVRAGQIAVVGAMYDVTTGNIDFGDDAGGGRPGAPA